MKKVFCLLLVLVLVLGAGCARKDNSLAGSEGVVKNPVDAPVADGQEEIDVPKIEVEAPADSEATEETGDGDEEQNEEAITPEPEKKTIEEVIDAEHPILAEHLKGKEYIIVQARKSGENEKVADLDLPNDYEATNRIPMEITKVYRGNLNVGDKINYWEFMGKYTLGGEEITYIIEGLDPVQDDTEYLMVLYADSLQGIHFYRAVETTSVYYACIPTSHHEAIAQRINEGTATQYDQLHYALLEGLVE